MHYLLTPSPAPSPRRSIGHLALLLALSVLTACSAPRGAKNTLASADLRSTVESTTAAFHEALRTNDSAGVLARVADDVLMLPPGEPPVRGKEAMRAWLATFLSQYHTSGLTLTDREVFVGEGWATEVGTYEWQLTPTAGGAATVDRGHYMQVWHQGPDGHWRFAREIWNSSAPPPSAVAQ